MSMKTIMRGALVACCAALGLNAWADTIACWNGDLDVGSTKGGLTISNLSSALYPEGTMKLTKVASGTSNPKGIYLTTADGAPLEKDTVTFIFKYSGYDSSNANNAVLAADMGTAEETHILQVFTQNAEHKVNVGYNIAAGQGMALSNLTIPSEGMIAVMMSNVSGIRVLVATKNEDGSYSAFNKNGCQYSGAKYGTVFKSFMIAGSDKNAGSYHRPGMTVDGIAVLDEVIDNGFTYTFPTEATYVKGSLNGYINTSTAQTFIPNATLAEIKSGTIKAKINGGNISSGFKNQVIRPLFVTEVMDGETISKVTMQFQLKESETMAKVVLAECTQEGDNVVIKATAAKHSTVSNAYGTDATGWTGGGTVVTSDTAAGYGIHELQFLAPSVTDEINESVNWADAGITPAASGVKTVYVASGATITFAAGDSVEGFQFVGKNEGDGVSVAGTIPSNIVILDREILSDTATISNFATAAVTVDGAVTMTTDVNVTAGSVITLNGGSLTGGDSARLHVIGNASISASGTASISNLWMGGTTHGVVATMTVAEGGELTLGKIVNSYTHTIVKDGAGVLKVTSNISNKQVAYQLKAGTLVGKDSETAITKHSSVSGAYKIVASEPVEGYTTYSLGPRTDPTTVELRSNNKFYIDNDETSLLEGDSIVVKTTWGNLWSFTLPTTLTAYTITLDSGIGTGAGINMKSDIPAGQTLVVNNPAVWLYENVGSGANVSGSGALRMWVDGKSITSATISTTTFGVDTGCTITINGDVTVSGTTLEINGTLKLADGATLTIAKLEDEGEEITKVVSGVDGKHVEYSDGKYVLVDDKTPAQLFAEAINAAESGATVTLGQDITLDARIDVVAAGKTITIDLGGYKITPTATCGNGSAFNVVSGTVTIKNGTIDGSAITQTSDDRYNNECDAITVRSGANVTLEGLIVKVNSITGSCAYPFNGATLTVLSGTYTNASTTEGPARELGMCFNQADVATQAVFVKGGSMSKNPALGDNSGKCTSFLAEGYVSTLNTATGLYDVTEKPQPTRPSDVESGSKEQKDAFDAWVEKHSVTDPSTANVNAFILDMPNESTDAELKTKLALLITPEMVQKLAADGATTETTVTIPGYGNAVFKFVPATLGEGVTTSAKLFRLKATFVPANSQK